MTDAVLDTATFERYFAALGRADAAAALAVSRGLRRRGVPPEHLLLGLVVAGQVEVGRRWQGNEWDVAREHAATAVSERVVADIVAEGCPEPTRGRVLVACVENEWHALAGRVVTELLRLHGWDAMFLGASIPPPALAQYLHDTGPHAVALSCSVPSSLPYARRLIEASREAGVPVLVGGRGFGPDGLRAAHLGASAWAATAHDALDRLDTCPPYAAPPPPVNSRWLAEYAALRAAERQVPEALPRRVRPDAAPGREDVEHVLRFLAAALFADDERILDEFLVWLAGVHAARHVPPARLPATLAEIAAVLPPLPRCQELLARGAAGLRDQVAAAAADPWRPAGAATA